MGNRVRITAALVLFLLPVAAARADGLGPHGLDMMAGVGASVAIGGLILSVAVILAGFYLARGRQRWPVGVWRKISFLFLFGLLVLLGGSALILWYFGG